MMQECIAAAIVAYATWVVLKRYAPLPLRRTVRRWAVRTAEQLGWRGVATRLARNNAGPASCADGCGPCGGCGAPDTVQPEPQVRQFTITPEALKRTARNGR